MVPRAALARSAQALLPLLPLLFLPACGEDSQVSAPPPPDTVPSIAGTYRVEGITEVIGADLSRKIAGTVILAQEGGHYTATFDLSTNYPGPDGAVPADVVGTGEGRIDGTALKGTARTQIVASRVPGLDPGFILVPPAFGIQVVSTAEGTINADGTLAFQLENRGVEGEDYVPTRTTVKGVRIVE